MFWLHLAFLIVYKKEFCSQPFFVQFSWDHSALTVITILDVGYNNSTENKSMNNRSLLWWDSFWPILEKWKIIFININPGFKKSPKYIITFYVWSAHAPQFWYNKHKSRNKFFKSLAAEVSLFFPHQISRFSKKKLIVYINGLSLKDKIIYKPYL